ncbi:hypothetical protein [Teredinibacter purpureus]|uniref:hypothetical protein n=1 Tax=Teredinibacter purpureus TaxID=2731756 RepID=UPI0005F7E416|nr:hypothetical protein [Teredinibacter purpureus]
MYRMLLLISFLVIGSSAHARIFSGFSEADITPTDSEGMSSCMGGYGAPFQRCGISQSSSSIMIGALSIIDYNDIIILVSIDSVGIGHSLKSDIIQAAREISQGRLWHANILISATHSHSGPDFQGLWGGVDPGYRERVVRTAARAILQSYLNRTKTEIDFWTSDANIENRRGLDVVDSTVEILDFRSAKFGHRIATLVNMSAHPTIVDETNFTWNSDYVGHLRATVNRNLNTNTIFFNGILGDAQPAINGNRGLIESEAYGRSTGEQISNSAGMAQKLSAHDISYSETSFLHPIENPLIFGALQLGILDANVDLENNIHTQIGIINIGSSFSAIVFPGEALTNIGLPLLMELSKPNTMFLGLTGDSLGYFLPRSEFGSIPGRTTEENASISSSIGDSAIGAFSEAQIDLCTHRWKKCN